MVHGIGTDILKISNIAHMVSNESDPFVRKTFTENELQLISSRPIPQNSFATRFAGKEAVFKTLGIDGNHFYLNQIEILENSIGQPTVNLLGKANEIAKKKGITTIHISLSYDTDYATAFAVALCK